MIMLVTKTDPDAGYDGFTIFLVPMDAAGRGPRAEAREDGHARLRHGAARVPGRARPRRAILGQEGKGFYHIMWELQAERLIGAAGCLAYAQYAFDQTLEYANERKTFGKPLGTHQAIRHKFAEMATKLEAARQLIYATAAAYAAGAYNVREISMAKLKARASPGRSPTSASRSTAAPATCGSTRSSACSRHPALPDRCGRRRDPARRDRALVRLLKPAARVADEAIRPTASYAASNCVPARPSSSAARGRTSAPSLPQAAPLRIPLAMTNRHGLSPARPGPERRRHCSDLPSNVGARRPRLRRRRQGRRHGSRRAREAGQGRGARQAELGLAVWAPTAFPGEFLSLGGIGPGVPVRATVSDFGPQLLGEGPRGQRDAGAVARARLPLRRRARACRSSTSPTCARC